MKVTVLQKLPAYTAALFPFISVMIGKGYNYASVLVLFCALVALFPLKKHSISKESKAYIVTLVFYFLSFVITVIYTQNPLANLDRPSRAILVIPIFIALLRYPPTLKMLASNIILGAYAVGVVALYYHINFPNARAFDDVLGGWWMKGYMQIQTGGMAATLSVSCLVLTLYLIKHKRFLCGGISLGGALFALYASLQSGSRGAWLFLPIAVLYLVVVNRHLLRGKILFLSTLSIALFCFIATQDMVQERIQQGQNDIELYLSGNNKSTSLGIRLELWKSAFYTFTENPILGAGTKERVASRRMHGDKGLIDKKVSRQIFHAHNQFLENLSMYGIVGFIGLLGILLCPLYLFEKKRRSSSNSSYILFCQLGSTSIIMMIGYCMTQAFFNHNSGIIYYVMFTSTVLAAVLSSSNDKKNELRSG